MGDRIEKGKIIDINEEYKNRLDPKDYEVVGEKAIESAVKTDESDVSLEDMKVSDLKDKAKSLGLSDKGNKKDLIERIELFLAGGEDTTDESDDESDEDSTDDVE